MMVISMHNCLLVFYADLVQRKIQTHRTKHRAIRAQLWATPTLGPVPLLVFTDVRIDDFRQYTLRHGRNLKKVWLIRKHNYKLQVLLISTNCLTVVIIFLQFRFDTITALSSLSSLSSSVQISFCVSVKTLCVLFEMRKEI